MSSYDPNEAFDWYFTDVSHRDASRMYALKDKPNETRELIHLLSADSVIHFALWNSLPENHPVRELWFETQTDLVATIYLAYGGFFRQALTVIRSWFEIAIHGVYFSYHYGKPTERYEQWRRGMRNAPANIYKLAESLASRPDMSFKVTKSVFLGKLEPIYSFLSQNAHAQGLDIYDLQNGRDNVPRYLPQSFDIWFKKIFQAFDAVCFLYRTFFIKEIVDYLKNSPEELKCAYKLTKLLSHLMPDFERLMNDVIANVKSP